MTGVERWPIETDENPLVNPKKESTTIFVLSGGKPKSREAKPHADWPAVHGVSHDP